MPVKSLRTLKKKKKPIENRLLKKAELINPLSKNKQKKPPNKQIKCIHFLIKKEKQENKTAKQFLCDLLQQILDLG